MWPYYWMPHYYSRCPWPINGTFEYLKVSNTYLLIYSVGHKIGCPFVARNSLAFIYIYTHIQGSTLTLFGHLPCRASKNVTHLPCIKSKCPKKFSVRERYLAWAHSVQFCCIHVQFDVWTLVGLDVCLCK